MTKNKAAGRGPSGHRHSGGLSIDYYAYASAIRCWNPALKVVASLLLLLLCIAADEPWVSAAAIVFCGIVTVGRGRLSLRRYGGLLMIPAVFILLGTVAIAVNFSRAPAGDFCVDLHWFFLSATREGLREAAGLILKAFGAVSAMFLLTLSTPSHELFTVLRRAHCPKLLVELMNMIYRFIFLLLDAQASMRISAQSRLGFCDFKTSCASFSGIAGNLLFLSLRRAGTHYDAMEARGYTGELLFLEEERKVDAEQLLWLGGGLLLLLVIWALTA